MTSRVRRAVPGICRLPRRQLSLSTPRPVWAVGKEDRGKLRPPILGAWRPVTPVPGRPWSAPYLTGTRGRGTPSTTTACTEGILAASCRPETRRFERWTKSSAWRPCSEGPGEDRSRRTAVWPAWVWGSLETTSLFREASPGCAPHRPRVETVASVRSRNRPNPAGRSPPGRSAGPVDLRVHKKMTRRLNLSGS